MGGQWGIGGGEGQRVCERCGLMTCMLRCGQRGRNDCLACGRGCGGEGWIVPPGTQSRNTAEHDAVSPPGSILSTAALKEEKSQVWKDSAIKPHHHHSVSLCPFPPSCHFFPGSFLFFCIIVRSDLKRRCAVLCCAALCCAALCCAVLCCAVLRCVCAASAMCAVCLSTCSAGCDWD